MPDPLEIAPLVDAFLEATKTKERPFEVIQPADLASDPFEVVVLSGDTWPGWRLSIYPHHFTLQREVGRHTREGIGTTPDELRRFVRSLSAHAPLPVLAIDPGKGEGGIVLMSPDARTILHAVAYKWLKDRKNSPDAYRVRRWVGGGTPAATTVDVEVASQHAVVETFLKQCRTDGRLVAPWPWLVVCEGLYVPSRRPGEPKQKYEGKLRNLQELSDSAGMLRGPFLPHASPRFVGDKITPAEEDRSLRPTASVWRQAILGIHPRQGLSSAACETLAKRACGARDSVVGLGALIRSPHVCEATCMAKWGHAQQRRKAQNQRYPGQGRIR